MWAYWLAAGRVFNRTHTRVIIREDTRCELALNDLSANELLDIVDDQDRVIGQDTRARVHAAGHLHRSAHIVLFNTCGEVFVQLRSMNKDSNPGLWDASAAGHVDSGESYINCAVRELREELGIEVDSFALEALGKLSPQARYGFEFTQIYSVCSEQPLVLQASEIDDGRWLLPDELDRWIQAETSQFTEVFKIIWPMVRPNRST